MNKQHSPLRTILSSRKTRFLLFALFIFCLVFGQQILVAFSQSTIYKRTITIENNLGNQTDYEFELLLDSRPLVTAGKLTPDCFNLKFIDDTNRELEYFLANGCNTDTTRIWIRIPTLSAGTNQLHMIYGPDVTSALRQEWHGGQLIAPFDGACPADWQAVSGLNDEQRFARGSESFGLTGGSENHNHTYAGNTNYVESTFTLTNAPSYTHPQNHRHVMSGTTSDVSHLPPYKDVIFCASYPGHIPNETGATSYIGLFETVPSEWNRSPSFDGRFLRGNNIAGGTGGTNAHTHIFSGNTNQVNPNSSQEDTYVGSSNRGIGGVHRHAYSGVTNEIEHLPPYLDMLVAHPSTANQALPAGMVTYFTQLPPIGWEVYSPLAGRFIRGSDEFGGIGGMDSHSHTLSGFTGYADGNPNDTRNGCCNHTSYDNHRHSYNLTSAPAGQLPPYLDVVPGRRQTSIANYVVGPETNDTATVFAVSPQSLLFPHTVETMSSQPLTVTVTNDETVSLTVSQLVLSGVDSIDFALSSDNCSGQIIAPGATCTFAVVFAPQSEGEKQASLNFVPANPLHFVPSVALHGISKDLQQVVIPITQNSSDARQASNNTVSVSHTVLFVNATWVAVGLQFGDVPLSPEADIVSAHLELTAQRNDSAVASYTIAAQAADDAPPFQNSVNNILAREQTTAVTEWPTIPAWTAGGVYNTPNLAAIVQEIVERPGWAAGNGMAFILTGSGNRRFWSIEGNSGAPAQLVIDYAVDPPPSTPTPTTTMMATPVVTSTQSPSATSLPGSSGVIYAINAGGGAYTALNGTLYEADNYYVGGNTTNFPNPVDGTEDDTLYQTERYGPLGDSIQYNFPVASGTYDVLLQFSEGHFTNAGERVFAAVVEGDLVVNDLDLAGTVGRDVAYDMLVQNVAVTDGNLDIDFHAVVENAKVSALVIYEAGMSPTSTPTPAATPPSSNGSVVYAINAGGGAYTAVGGRAYQADNYHIGGNTTNFSNPVGNTEDDTLYQTERYGPLGDSLQYNFPVGSGTYDVLLQFSEGHFSNAGERVFDTVVEGSLAVDDLDLAGTVGKDVAYDVFVQNVAVTDGNLDIDFHAVVENAKVSAIVIYDADASPTTTPTVTLPPTVTSMTTATATPSPATVTPAMGSCLVYYDNYDDWGTEFLADVYIVNLTNTPLAGYTLSWTFTGNQDITSSWSATFSQSGQTVTASNPAAHWNGTIDANGGMVEVGFSAAYSGNNTLPVDFTLTSPTGGCQITVIEGNPATPTSTPTPSQTPSTLQVTSLTLINAETDEDIGVINDGDTLNLATLPTQNLNVRADVAGPVDSVRFEFDTDPEYAWEGVAPYALAGDNNGDYNDWTPLPGPHTLAAIPYQQVNGEWMMGTGLLVTFTVVNDSTPTITPVPPTWTPTSTPTPTATATPTNTPTATATHTNTPTPTTVPTSTVTATVTPSMAGNECQLFYDLDVWMGGYIAELYLVNLRSTSIEGYTLSWDFTGDDVIVDDWNATFVQNGQAVTVSNPVAHWNGIIPANGGEVKIGFEASHTGDIVQTPTNISLVTNSGNCPLEIIPGNPATPTATPHPATATPSASPTQTPEGIRVTSLTLINAETDEDIGVINDGDTLNLATLPTQNLNVRADVAGPVDSVRFEFDTDPEYAWEGVAPYALAGDNNGDYNDWTPLPGPHTLAAIPYQQINGEWMMGTGLQVTFTVINDPTVPTATATPSTPTFTPTATATATVTPLITRTWQIVSPTINLNTNSDYAFAYVPTGNHLVLYGGNANGWPYQDETWTFGGLDWTLNSVTARPTAVYGMRMAGDILFGGSDVQDDVLAETWSYDGTSWQLLTPTTSPPPRLHHSMAYDSENGRVYLFGGQNGTGYYNGTWVYENSNWTLLTTSNTPPPRSLHSLIYRNDQLWVFGGRAVDGTSLNDLWHLDLITNEWTEITASGTSPAARMAHSMTYDRQQDRFLLFGGKPDASGTYLADSWLLDPTTLIWEEQVFAVSPPASGYHTALYDPLNNQVILVTNNAQTWIYK